MSLSSNGYKLLKLPEPNEEVTSSFSNLPPDPYCSGRFRRFSQYQMDFKISGWDLTTLPKRPHIQSKMFNTYVGGILRNFEELIISPLIYVDIVVNSLSLSKDETWHVDVHQWRTLCDSGKQVSSVPEGLHRDGHSFGAILVMQRHKITDGETQLFPNQKSTLPFFKITLNNLEGIVFDDTKMLHYTTDISPEDELGYRDIFVININPWQEKHHGDLFEKNAVYE